MPFCLSLMICNGFEGVTLILLRLNPLNLILLFIFVEFYTLFETTIGTSAGHSLRFFIQLWSKRAFLFRLFCLFNLTGDLPLWLSIDAASNLIIKVFFEFLRHNQSLVRLFLLFSTCQTHLIALQRHHDRLFLHRKGITILGLIIALILILCGHQSLILLQPPDSEFSTLVIYLWLMGCSPITLRVLIFPSLDFLLGQLLNFLLFFPHNFFVSLMKGPRINNILLFHLAHLLLGQLHFGSVVNGVAFFGSNIVFTFHFIFLAPLGVLVKSRGHRLKKLPINLVLFNR